MSAYCGAVHPDGWMCVLMSGHDGEHLSIDNRTSWKGTVGAPIRWATGITKRVAARVTPRKLPGYTGIPCDNCGSPNTVRNGKCLMCMDCKHSGECG